MKKPRSKFRIASDILKVISDLSLSSKGDIVLKANVSNSVLTNYLRAFIFNKLVSEVGITRGESNQSYMAYNITESGVSAMNRLNYIDSQFSWINDVGAK